ncbi:MAG: Y-family DNA polymerase, partial [Verrucomicrobiia bacterium]
MPQLFALVDCNNFYCSCERVFDPSLRGRPLVVLSNNDACIISRSEEAKGLGIRMGTPFFKARDLIRRHRVAVRSSNYALYGDMSQRVMNTLSEFAPAMEVYSIDEAFLLLDEKRADEEYGAKVRRTVLKWTGIPVSVGIGATKTLAKAANKLSKKDPARHGVLDLAHHPDPDALLATLPCGDVWGIGRRYAKFLIEKGITTALDLKRASRRMIRGRMGVCGERTLQELNGIPCFGLEEFPEANQTMCCARSFSKPITELAALEEAVAEFASRVGEKLRAQRSVAKRLCVLVMHNADPKRHSPFHAHAEMALHPPTADTPALIAAAHRLLRALYKPGTLYKKAGVVLTDLIPTIQVEPDL